MRRGQYRNDRRPADSRRKLGGFHFNDSKYSDDDLDAGSIGPSRLFCFSTTWSNPSGAASAPWAARILDQSHNVTDPTESLITSAIELGRAYAQVLLVDRTQLADYQQRGAQARLYVSPILGRARLQGGAAIDPTGAYRASAYRCAKLRPLKAGSRSGIV